MRSKTKEQVSNAFECPHNQFFLNRPIYPVDIIADREETHKYTETSELNMRKLKDFGGPPASWVARLQRSGLRSPAEIEAIWDALPRRKKSNHFAYERRVARGNRNLKIARAAPVEQEIHRELKEPTAAQRAASDRRSADRLAFRLQNAKGCSAAQCPLAEGSTPVPLVLLEHDHLDGVEKVASVTAMSGKARQEEAEKTVCLCLWHHHLHTRDQRGDRPVSQRKELSPIKQAVLLWKEMVHCEHPCHDSMPYAKLVPEVEEDDRIASFLDVSHLKRGRVYNSAYRSVLQLADLLSEEAVVHCKMCHALWTFCEHAMLYDTPRTRHQKGVMEQHFGAFQRHFDGVTEGFDWAAERIRLRTRQSKAQRRKQHMN